MTTSEQRRLLGEFVRTHRERMRPEAPAGRRRTPGLRREELAARAGFGATWQAWIEQGREVNASPAALARLAAALELTRAERAYLFELAGRRDPESADPEPVADAPVSIRAMVGALDCPAYGLDRDAIHALQQAASAGVRAHFAIEADGSFMLDTLMVECVAA